MIGFASDEFITGKVSALLSRNSSLSQAERSFVLAAGPDFKGERPTAVFRETLPLVYKTYPDAQYITGLLTGATDILRIATFLSDPAADLSLSENVRFKLSTSDKKNVLRLLETRDNLAEDMMRHRNKWLALGQKIALSADVKAKYPKTAAAFDQLRKAPEKIETFSRKIEHAMREKSYDLPLLTQLADRPGDFMRRLDQLLRTAEARDGTTSLVNVNNVMTGLTTAVLKAQTKLLLEIRKYLEHREANAGAARVYLPKGQVNRAQVRDDTREPISSRALAMAHSIISAELIGRFEKKGPLGKVFIDPALKGVVLPFNRRGDSATTAPILKGSRYKLSPDAEVIRMFVHWIKDTDVDLSLIMLGEDFSALETVSFSNLRSYEIVHSGDIQSAINGGSEFVDFNIEAAYLRGFRYAIMSLISYRGATFDSFPCYAGYMERDSLKSGQRYEPESVAVKFDVSGPVTNHMPVIFDLLKREIVYADMAGGQNHSHGTAMGKSSQLAVLAKAIVDLPNRKPTVYDVLELHAISRGQVVEDAEHATTIYGTDVDLDEVLAMTV